MPDGLTQLVEVGLDPVDSRDRADEPRLEERAPLVHQATVATVVILQQGGKTELKRENERERLRNRLKETVRDRQKSKKESQGERERESKKKM